VQVVSLIAYHRQAGLLRLDRTLEVLQQLDVMGQATPGFEGPLPILGAEIGGYLLRAGLL
jgi:hypothetical protein